MAARDATELPESAQIRRIMKWLSEVRDSRFETNMLGNYSYGVLSIVVKVLLFAVGSPFSGKNFFPNNPLPYEELSVIFDNN